MTIEELIKTNNQLLKEIRYLLVAMLSKKTTKNMDILYKKIVLELEQEMITLYEE